MIARVTLIKIDKENNNLIPFSSLQTLNIKRVISDSKIFTASPSKITRASCVLLWEVPFNTLSLNWLRPLTIYQSNYLTWFCEM